MNAIEWVLFLLFIAILVVGGWVWRSAPADAVTQWQKYALLLVGLGAIVLLILARM